MMKMTTFSTTLAGIDFLSRDYSIIGEPLNLIDRGRDWFKRICCVDSRDMESSALVLGAIPWIGEHLRQYYKRVILVDVSPAMLEMTRLQLEHLNFAPYGRVDLVQANWTALPDFHEPLSLVVGDNSLSFLQFPDAWLRLFDDLARRMRPGARLLTRMLAIPATHRPLSIDDIICRFAGETYINSTEVRTLLLLSHWNPATYEIQTEDALDTFERNRLLFQPLLDRFTSNADNDLVTVRKYRDTGAVYFAPPLENILDVLRTRFRPIEVHFGPYPLQQYFPLIVAIKDPA
jgi:SAM-dependent methyltransferase